MYIMIGTYICTIDDERIKIEIDGGSKLKDGLICMDNNLDMVSLSVYSENKGKIYSNDITGKKLREYYEILNMRQSMPVTELCVMLINNCISCVVKNILNVINPKCVLTLEDVNIRINEGEKSKVIHITLQTGDKIIILFKDNKAVMHYYRLRDNINMATLGTHGIEELLGAFDIFNKHELIDLALRVLGIGKDQIKEINVGGQ